MKINTRILWRILFACEMLIFVGIYFFSTHGIHAVLQLDRENVSIEHEIRHLQNEIVTLEYELIAWQNNSFYQEKIAREQLQMARENDEIYYIT